MSTLTFEAQKTAVAGQEVLVSVKIHTLKDKVNAVSGSVVLDPKQVEVVKVYRGDSAVTLWIDAPNVTTTSRGIEIPFSGITPGGFQGDFTLFSFVAKPLRSGAVSISGRDLTALRNDGEGTSVAITVQQGTISVRSGTGTSTVTLSDTVPPEAFAPIVSSSKDAFDGKAFVSFMAQDKESGISRYEVAHKMFLKPSDGDWVPAQSPYVLPEGAYSHRIFVKAVDMSGNERISSVAGPSRYETFAVWFIIIVIIALCAFLFTKRRSSSSHR